MDTVKALVFFILVSSLILLILATNAVGRLLKRRRRKKHPEYFKYYNEAAILSFERGARYSRRRECFDYKLKLFNDGLRDGECTKDYYFEQLNKLMIEYQELCDWFQNTEKEIRELLVKADLYAKEHNLRWGVLYGD